MLVRSDELLQTTLEKTRLPVKPYEYKGTKTEYIVYNEEDERGIGHADDRPQAESIWWQIHLFTPVTYDYRAMKRKIRNLLYDAGFSVGPINTIYESDDTETVHVVISCNMHEGMEE